ncbi:MAG TPA: glycosyltransferase family 2 protein [Arsenicitalea sp.]|jgi:glycosyltransferase involved in cell wall biosynthesis|nr:glycosyltransferase family 2 protein [Arsenicitalea sp.]
MTSSPDIPNSPPLFSVVIPTHNRPQLLQRAVASVLEQSFADFEVLVIDDGSTTPAAEALSSLADSRIRLFRNDIAQGVSAARNRGVAEARGLVVSFLDDDDVWLPELLEAMAGIFAKPSTTGPVVAWSPKYHVDDAEIAARLAQPRPKPALTSSPHPVRADLSNVHVGCGFALSVPTQAIRAIGGFDTRLTYSEDFDLIIRLVEHGLMARRLDDWMVLYATHATGSSITERSSARQRALQHFAVWRKNRAFLHRRYGAEGYLIRFIARDLIYHGHARRAFRIIHSALHRGGYGPWVVIAAINAHFLALRRRLKGTPL